MVQLKDLGLSAYNRVDYEPSPWFALRRILRRAEVKPHDVSIDFGCGKGRVLLEAANLGFNRVVGVELAKDLADVAKANVARSLPKLRCRHAMS